MRYVAGIDGGQSATKAAIADERGAVLGLGEAGPSDEVGQGASSTRMHDALAAALESARRDAGLDPSLVFDAVVAGVSGYEGRLYGAAPALPARSVALVHDAAIAHAGAFAGGSGVVVIAGTGSVAYVVDDEGKSGLHGGLGYLFGDEGSAFWIARTAMAAAASSPQACAVQTAAQQFFGAESMREIFAAFYHGSLGRDRIASFARVVVEIFNGQSDDDLDPCAFDTIVEAHEHLARLAGWASFDPWSWRDRCSAAFVGGLMADASFADAVRSATRAIGAIDVVEPAYAPVLGAALLALREIGVERPRLQP